MSLPEQLIGWPGTQEQLRKLVALFSEVKRVQRGEGEQRSRNWSFISQISLSGMF